MTTAVRRQQLVDVETTCESLLDELQLIWDEVGESDEERDTMLLLLEQECLEIYRRTVDRANHERARLHQRIAESQAELASLSSVLAERVPKTQEGGSLKEELAALVSLLEDLRKRKDERSRQFLDLKAQIERVHSEIYGSSQSAEPSNFTRVNEHDLSLRKFDELHGQLQVLQKEKNDRLYKVLEYVNTVHELCGVLSCDFLEKITEVHPSLNEASSIQAKSISNETIELLAKAIESLRNKKRERMQQLQDFGASLIELWSLMDTPSEEQQSFQYVTCSIAALEHEITAAGALSMDVIEQAKHEVERLHQLKASKVKEILLKKHSELEEVCRKAHALPDTNTTLDKTLTSMESGLVDPAELLASIEEQIGRAREEAFSRKEIMEKVEKWISACKEETWLEDYNKDENRYNASRGAHINLKRAERARTTISKIPGLVESLMAKIKSWEEDRGKPLLYDGVRLLSTLEEYTILRIEKEEERKRHRDQRRLHEQLVNKQETLFGAKPSPISRTPYKQTPTMRANGTGTPALRRLSLGGVILQAGTTPSKYGTPGSKESRKRPGALSSRAPISGDDNTSTAGARQPLSPVSAPVVRQNLNSVNVKKKRYNAYSPMKVPFPRTPLSAASLHRQVVTDEENTTPVKASAVFLLRTPLPASLLGRPAVIGEANSMSQQPLALHDHHEYQPHGHPLPATLISSPTVMDEGHITSLQHQEQVSMKEHHQQHQQDQEQQQQHHDYQSQSRLLPVTQLSRPAVMDEGHTPHHTPHQQPQEQDQEQQWQHHDYQPQSRLLPETQLSRPAVMDEGHTAPQQQQEQQSMIEYQQREQGQEQEWHQPHSISDHQQQQCQQQQQHSNAESQQPQHQQQQQQSAAKCQQHHHQKQQQQETSFIEYSFEEKRLGFIYHSDAHLCTRAGCI